MIKKIFWFLSWVALLLLVETGWAASGNELHFCIRADPKTFNPLLVEDDASETVRYLTGGVLVRVNRQTQEYQPELATSWRISNGGRQITFDLRQGIKFSDGTPFSAEDVAFTMRQLLDPSLHSPTGDAFRSGKGTMQTQVLGSGRVAITFPAPVAGMIRLFDQVAIMSTHSPQKEMAVLGPFYVSQHEPGSYLILKRNPYYWKRDKMGRQLPYIDSVRLDIQQNRDLEMLRFRRGEIHLINSLDGEYFAKLMTDAPAAARDAGVSLDSEQMWFNQVPTAPIAPYKRDWFRSANFRRAISEAVHRDDMARIVFLGYARPAVGPVSPANKFWFNTKLHAEPPDTKSALQRLQQDDFRLEGGVLRDRLGNKVEFSIITNAGNKSRERMATMIQQDLGQIGIKLNLVILDFPALIERITQSFNYEACLLGLVNVDLDPDAQMNVWLSSGANHQWNPEQKSPATAWEAEIDKLMQAQASTADDKKRKEYFDRVQEIVHEQAPFVYLVNKDALSGISDLVQNAKPVILRPQTYWNIEELSLRAGRQGGQ